MRNEAEDSGQTKNALNAKQNYLCTLLKRRKAGRTTSSENLRVVVTPTQIEFTSGIWKFAFFRSSLKFQFDKIAIRTQPTDLSPYCDLIRYPRQAAARLKRSWERSFFNSSVHGAASSSREKKRIRYEYLRYTSLLFFTKLLSGWFLFF